MAPAPRSVTIYDVAKAAGVAPRPAPGGPLADDAELVAAVHDSCAELPARR